jgi:hypothetical protein
LQDLPKFTQIGIFGLKIWHLATLVPADVSSLFESSFFLGGGRHLNLPTFGDRVFQMNGSGNE